ncbi:MAG: 5-formyltetrahydrofolate cyclo-ligase [Acidothermus sp.]|nr:5-formyltetrahydrofolate cyclo-ligase [Acidothermus sp.]MCL6538421.1 5-formyltetrahydrofolate cyclo-ligase [Acidothermus sp.]
MSDPHPLPPDKAELRARLLAERARLTADQRSAAGRGIARAFAELLGERRPRLCAVYLAIGTEPPTGPLIEVLAERGADLIVPLVTPDGELDWVPYRPGARMTKGPRGTLLPADIPPLGRGAIGHAELVVVPALAVAADGARLGRGGGGYDRALVRRGPGSTVLAVVYENEVVPELPTEPHDQRVDGVLTPGGGWWVAPGGRR